MNEIVSFNKEIEFNTNIDRIISISLEHTISPDKESSIKGDLIVSGTYKENDLNNVDKPFSYKIPVDIVLDEKYDLSNIIIDIDDFTYEIIDNNKLKVNIDLSLNNLELKKQEEKVEDEIISVNDLFLEQEETKPLEIPNIEEEKEEVKPSTIIEEQSDSLFATLDSSNETYSTYSVYIVRDNDSLDEIMNKYKVSKTQLEEYNNLSDFKNGTKLIIPSSNE